MLRVVFGASVLTVASLAAVSAEARERCYGIAPAGEADGIDNREEAGAGEVDYQGNAWVWVEDGACLRTVLPPRPDGTPRRGGLEPLERDRPS